MSEEKTTPTEPATTASQTRRAFLQRLTLGSLAVSATTIAAAGALATIAPTDAEAAHIQKDHGRKIKVFRLKSRGTHACRACQLHHRHIMFLTKQVAKHHRAHKHCNCPIVPQWIKRKTYHRLFKGAALETGVVDLRKH